MSLYYVGTISKGEQIKQLSRRVPKILRTLHKFGKLTGLTALMVSKILEGSFSFGWVSQSDSQLSISCEIISMFGMSSLYCAQND